jgi:hypothetical protein
MARTRGASSNMTRLEAVVAKLPEAVRVDVAEWGDHPTFRVRNTLVAPKTLARQILDRPPPSQH